MRVTRDSVGNFIVIATEVMNVDFCGTPTKVEHEIFVYQGIVGNLMGWMGTVAVLVMRLLSIEGHLGERSSCVALLGGRIKLVARARVVTTGTVVAETLARDLTT